jgi:hypothetical protein
MNDTAEQIESIRKLSEVFAKEQNKQEQTIQIFPLISMVLGGSIEGDQFNIKLDEYTHMLTKAVNALIEAKHILDEQGKKWLGDLSIQAQTNEIFEQGVR